jgi:hypothetical protein
MSENAKLDWHVKEYELIRSEIAARASIHHSFMGWAMAGAAGIAWIGIQKDVAGADLKALAWDVLLPAWVCIAATAVFLEWVQTERLGRYGAMLETEINSIVGIDPASKPSGWERSIHVRRTDKGDERWGSPVRKYSPFLMVVLALIAGLPGDWLHEFSLPLFGVQAAGSAAFATFVVWRSSLVDKYEPATATR